MSFFDRIEMEARSIRIDKAFEKLDKIREINRCQMKNVLDFYNLEES